jgi:hypothetical protein
LAPYVLLYFQGIAHDFSADPTYVEPFEGIGIERWGDNDWDGRYYIMISKCRKAQII